MSRPVPGKDRYLVGQMGSAPAMALTKVSSLIQQSQMGSTRRQPATASFGATCLTSVSHPSNKVSYPSPNP